MSLIVCRKCGGEHLTIKCGKNKETKIDKKEDTKIDEKEDTKIDEEDTKIDKKEETKIEEKLKDNKEKIEENEIRTHNSRISYRVKMSELPNDITEDEMMELCNNWGYITKLKVINYEETSVAYIDFNKEECANYFVEALHRTPFEHLILNVTRVESNI